MEFRVRAAEPADVPVIVELSAGLFAEDAGSYDVYTDQGWPRREGEGYFAKVVDDPMTACWLAEIDGVPVGSLVGRLYRETSLRPVRVAELESLFVQSDHRGAGVGSALVAAFQNWAREQRAERAAVTAYADNERGLAFYRRHGFAPKSVTLEKSV